MLFHRKDDVTRELEALLKAFKNKEPGLLAELGKQAGTPDPSVLEALRLKAILALNESLKKGQQEEDGGDGDNPHPAEELFHSRDPLTGIIQSHLKELPSTESADLVSGDAIPQLEAYGEGNPVVWLPTGVKAILEHFKPKANFITATNASKHPLPDKCKIALVSDWGADNDHAKRIGELIKQHKAEYVIHLGDIYYSGADHECEKFIENWPLRDEKGPIQGKSFALNGNHEMYSGGHGYFKIVLPALGQEASYFSLSNEYWQFFGLDTAYVPFSIGGGSIDTRLTQQLSFLVQGLSSGEKGKKKGILLSHNQPVSAHLPEFEASIPLFEEYWNLVSQTGLHYNDIFAWFFGHEHRCTIYDDTAVNFRARLIGNGAIPHYPQTETKQAFASNGASTTPFTKVNSALYEGGPLAMSSFVLITLDGPSAHVEYINEDGSLFFEETWN